MNHPLLVTKLYIPLARPNLVPRSRLIAELDEGLRGGKRLTLVSAPAGFGKTTLLTTWVYTTTCEVAWISLDEDDNDPLRFLAYLIAALQQGDGRIGRAIQPLLQSTSPLTPSTRGGGLGEVQALIADIDTAATPLILVLDDYHLIDSPAVHAITAYLLEHAPPSLHLVISTREDPPLPLPRLRARNHVTELCQHDLRFTPGEAAAFLNQTMHLPLSPEIVEALETRTEGWIAGLQLAALALQDMLAARNDAATTQTFIAAFRSDNRYILDYLITEVLQHQPADVRAFLRQTVILDRLTASLCNAVTGRDDGQAMLERLEAANLFLVPLDHRREWYRYHRLFAGVLRPTLAPNEAQRLHQNAAQWHETQGDMQTAIQHALAAAVVRARRASPAPADSPSPADTPPLADAARLIRAAAEPLLHSGNIATVTGWLDALPDAHIRADSHLALYRGWIHAFTGNVDTAIEYAAAAEACLRRDHPGGFPELGQRPRRGLPAETLGKLRLLRAYIALGHRDYKRATQYAGDALNLLKKADAHKHVVAHWRVLALWAMAESQERTAPITEAITTLQEARRVGQTLDNQIFAAVVEMSLAAALNNHSLRREAVAVCNTAIARHTDAAGHVSPLAGLLFSRLALLTYEANQLTLAREHYERGLALSEQLAIGSLLMFAYGVGASILHAHGETEAAFEAIHKAHALAPQEALTDANWRLAAEADIRLEQGDLAFAARWAAEAGLTRDTPPQYLTIEQHLTYARLLLAQGRLADARAWLAQLERFTQSRQLFRWTLTVHILQTLVEDRAGHRPTALDRLARALKLAAPHDYVRAFLDEGDHIATLLPDVRHAVPAFVDQLLHAMGAHAPPAPAPQSLPEPLSAREIEVLRLLAQGMSNKEIAQKLVIAVGTVKQHLKRIYTKLDVHNRTEAANRARELRLL